MKTKIQDSRFKIPDSNCRGQSLFELVVAIAISALVIVAIVSLVASSIRNANYSKNNGLASSFAQSATEWLRSERDRNIGNFMVNAQSPKWCIKDSPLTTSSWSQVGACGANDYIPGTIFLREARFTNTTVSGKTVVQTDVVVTWTDAQGIHVVTNTTNFTDWRQR